MSDTAKPCLPARRTHQRWSGATALLKPAWAAALLMAMALPGQAARLALVIGNDNYQLMRPLVNAAKDATDVAAALRATGFSVPGKWVVINGTRRKMDAALQDFVSSLGPDDEVVFYYSGHGVEIDSQAALVPIDLPDPARRPIDGALRPLSEIEDAKRQVLEDSITLNRVAADIARRNVKFSLLIVDACRDNPVLELLKSAHAASPVKSTGPGPTAGLIADIAADTQVLLFSASKGQQSLDRLGPGDLVRNGVFTRVLLEAMGRPGLGLREMLPGLKADVRRLAATARVDGRPHAQDPRTMAAFDAPNFYFRPPLPALPAPAVPPRSEVPPLLPAPATQAVEIAFWNSISTSRNPAELREYLRRFPNGDFALLARERLTGLAPAQGATQLASVLPAPARPAPAAAAAGGLRVGEGVTDCDVCPALVVIPEGSFTMGSSAGEVGRDNDEGPQRSVRVASFLLGKTEVTQGQWQAVMGSNPSHFQKCGAECPVEKVSWNDAQDYVKELNARSGKTYRLPSEAEWEYAARAGSTTRWSFGDAEGQLGDHAWFSGNSGSKTRPVASKRPNGFGLYDMHGNVLEWVQDCYDKKAYAGKAPSDGGAYEVAGCSSRVLRGGLWANDTQWLLRSAIRYSGTPDVRYFGMGFRLARTLP